MSRRVRRIQQQASRQELLTRLRRHFRPRGEWLEDRAMLAVFDVTTTADSGAGSLRQALLDANSTANVGGIPDEIHFDIAGTGPQTIAPLSALPTITEAVIVDAWSEPDYAGTPIIEIRGDSAGSGVTGLTITSSGSTIRGLVINRFAGHGILVTGASATGNVIGGNYIGTDVSGALDLGNAGSGLQIQSGASGNTIGGDVAGAGNVISGNNARGIMIQSSAHTNLVQGNIVGLNGAGSADLGNSLAGIEINTGAGNTIGGITALARNVVSGNNGSGVVLNGNSNVVIGNYIGTNSAGTAAIRNTDQGVNVFFSTGNRIGTNADGLDDAAEGNVIVGGTGQTGVQLDHGSGHTVAGNYIGLASDGSTVLGSAIGIRAFFSPNNLIGGPTPAARNVVSGNTVGINLFGGSNNTVQGNYVGANALGTLARGNQDGIRIQEGNDGGNLRPADDNQIIGNVVAGNTRDGISLGATARNNVLTGNYVGVNAAGTAALANQATGILVQSGASGNRIGTDGNGINDASEGNLVSGNAFSGIAIINGHQTIVAGNKIGTNAAGTAAVGNGEHGIFVGGGSQATWPSGTSSAEMSSMGSTLTVWARTTRSSLVITSAPTPPVRQPSETLAPGAGSTSSMGRPIRSSAARSPALATSLRATAARTATASKWN
jgi:parallel beta-helix repeat protein